MLQYFHSLIEVMRRGRYSPPLVYHPDLDQIQESFSLGSGTAKAEAASCRGFLQRFEALFCDVETCAFIHRASRRRVFKWLLAKCLYPFFSFTTINGLLQTAPMFVLSTAQLHWLLRGVGSTGDKSAAPAVKEDMPLTFPDAVLTMLMKKHNGSSSSETTPGAAAVTGAPVFQTILDLGSGNGDVTETLLPFCEKAGDISVTEISPTMRHRLKSKGFTVLDYTDPFHDPPHSGQQRRFDLITCFNLLDRMDTPLTLLRQVHEALQPNGVFLLAVVMPWCPFVEDGAGKREPKERLPMEGGFCCGGASYEASLGKLVQNVLLPAGFKVVRWTEVPYLCEGDLWYRYTVLYDAVLVLQKSE